MTIHEFGKHYSSMYTGSMRGRGALVFAVMGYVIASQVPEMEVGSERMVVELNPEVVAFLLGEEEVDVETAIEFLCEPDPRSRSKQEGGRRLVKLGEYLYWVVNGRKYREWNAIERRREQNREAKQRERQRKPKPAKSKGQVRNENLGRERRFVKADGDGEGEAAGEIAAEGMPGNDGVTQ